MKILLCLSLSLLLSLSLKGTEEISPLEKLPTEILVHICLFLDKDSFADFKETSRKIYQILNKDQAKKTFWTQGTYTKYQVLKHYSDFKVIKEQGIQNGNFELWLFSKEDFISFLQDEDAQNYTKKLLISLGPWREELQKESPPDYLRLGLGKFTQLKAIHFSPLNFIYSFVFRHILFSLPSLSILQEIRIGRCTGPVIDLLPSLSPQLHNLKSLFLSLEIHGDDENFIKIFSSLKNLESLTIDHGRSKVLLILETLRSTNPSSLHHLRLLYSLPSTANGIRELSSLLSSFTNLEILDIVECSKDAPHIYCFDFSPEKIKMFTLSFDNPNKNFIPPLISLFSNFHHLQHLNLIGNWLIPSEASTLLLALPHPEGLESLNLECNLSLFLNLAYGDLFQALFLLKNIRTLNLSHTNFGRYSDHFTLLGELLQNHCRKLRRLIIQGMPMPQSEKKRIKKRNLLSQALSLASPQLKYIVK